MGALELLIEAVNKNTEAQLAVAAALGNTSSDAGSKSTSSKSTSSTKSTTTKKETEKKTGPKHTKAETTEAIVTLKDTVGVDAAKTLLAAHGFKKVADITEDKFDVLFDEATAQLEEHNAGGEENTDDDI
jgi:hypothetical protein